jgi:hypothetical protein
MKKASMEDIWNQAARHVESGLNPVYKKIRDEKRNEKLDSLMELIDNFAETRHTCGHWTYSVKCNEARQKVIAALKGEV